MNTYDLYTFTSYALRQVVLNTMYALSFLQVHSYIYNVKKNVRIYASRVLFEQSLHIGNWRGVHNDVRKKIKSNRIILYLGRNVSTTSAAKPRDDPRENRYPFLISDMQNFFR